MQSRSVPLLDGNIPFVELVLDPKGAGRQHELCRALVQDALGRMLPSHVRTNHALLRTLLPILQWSEYQYPPFDLSFFLLGRHRPSAFKFFYEMISRWLVPGTQLDVLRIASTDFYFPAFGEEVYTLSEVVARVPSESKFAILKRHLPSVEAEILLGAKSAVHARRILEARGVSSNEKTAMIQEDIAWVMKRRGRSFGEDVLREMQHFFVQSRAEFLASHGSRHISRLICIHSFYRRELRQRMADRPKQRHVIMKFVPGERRCGNRMQPFLGIFAAVNILRGNEIFEERQLLRAVAHHIPEIEACPGTYLSNAPRDDDIQTLYLEVTKPDHALFSKDELVKLRCALPGDLKSRIAHQMHSVFMPQNDEEIMRYILTLSDQLKLVRDLPQVVILFGEQTDLDIVFTVVLLRVLRRNDPSLVELFSLRYPQARISSDLVRVVGHVRKRRQKEANVFRLYLKKEQYLRSDCSLDLFHARQTVVATIRTVIGEFRDYNGGMIAKQEEVLSQVRKELGSVADRHDWLLENVFHSMRPVVMRSVLEPVPVARLFRMLVEALSVEECGRSGVHIKTAEDQRYLYALMVGTDQNYRQEVLQALAKLKIPSMRLISTQVQVADAYVIGLIYQTEEELLREEMVAVLNKELTRASCRSPGLSRLTLPH